MENINKTTLILSHNKTLAYSFTASLKFFPTMRLSITYLTTIITSLRLTCQAVIRILKKDLAINDEIDKLRLAATSALLQTSGRAELCRPYRASTALGNAGRFL